MWFPPLRLLIELVIQRCSGSKVRCCSFLEFISVMFYFAAEPLGCMAPAVAGPLWTNRPMLNYSAHRWKFFPADIFHWEVYILGWDIILLLPLWTHACSVPVKSNCASMLSCRDLTHLRCCHGSIGPSLQLQLVCQVGQPWFLLSLEFMSHFRN